MPANMKKIEIVKRCSLNRERSSVVGACALALDLTHAFCNENVKDNVTCILSTQFLQVR